jgi:hypothetical protein
VSSPSRPLAVSGLDYLLRRSIVLITLIKVITYWRDHGRTHLLSTFLKDGIQYFAVVTSANIVNVVYMRSKVSVMGVKFTGGSFNAAMALAVTSMMVSRLIIVSTPS